MNKRFAQIDSIRFFSILIIILYHYQKFRFPGGFLGVNLFLIISGMLLAIRLENEWLQQHSISIIHPIAHTIKKLIVPVLWVIGVLSTVLIILRHDLLTNWLMQMISTIFFFNNWYQIAHGASYFADIIQPSILTHLWYLSVYLQCFIIIHVLFKWVRPLIKKRQHFGFLLLGLSLVSFLFMIYWFDPNGDPTRVYYGTDTRFSSVVLGAGLMLIEPTQYLKKLHIIKYPSVIQCGLLAALIFMVLTFTDQHPMTYIGGMYLFDVLASFFILMILYYPTIVQSICSFTPFVKIGQLSFYIYLWYYPIFIGVYNYTGTLPQFITYLPVQLLLILLLAALTKKWIEYKPTESHTLPHSLDELKYHWETSSMSHKLRLSLYVISFMSVIISIAISTTQTDTIALDLEKKYTERQNALSQENEQRHQSSNAEHSSALDESSDTPAIYTADNLNVTFFGDSTILSGSQELYSYFPKAFVYGEIGLQLFNAYSQLDYMNSMDQLHPIVVFSLGSNGTFTTEQLDELIAHVGKDSTIFFVTSHANRSWVPESNAQFSALADKNEHVHLIDWASHFDGQYQFLEPDGVHLNAEGVTAWVSFIEAELLRQLND